MSHVIDLLVNSFNNLCLSTLDSVAPVKIRTKPTSTVFLWFNDNTRSLKSEVRKAECKWKTNKLKVHYEYLKTLMKNYNVAVKDARATYFSNLISQNAHRSKISFGTLERIVGPPTNINSHASSDLCEQFKTFFTEKIVNIRSQTVIRPTIHLSLICHLTGPLKFHPYVLLVQCCSLL